MHSCTTNKSQIKNKTKRKKDQPDNRMNNNEAKKKPMGWKVWASGIISFFGFEIIIG